MGIPMIKYKWWVFVIILICLALPFLTPYHALASEMLIFAIFALGYDIIFGYTGLLSFGHAMFFGIGAYGTGLVLTRWIPSLFLGLATGIAISLSVAFIVGFLSIRRRGIYFVMVTLAFCQMLYFIAFKWTSLTGGDNGLHGVPRPLIGPFDLNSELLFYYFIFSIFALSVLVAFRIVNSPFGRVLQSLRENEERAKSIGYNTDNFKVISFMTSAFFSSLAGGLYAVHLNFVPLDTLSIFTSGDVVIMALVGGIGTLYGPIFGAMLIVYLKNLLSAWMENWNLIMGLLFISSVLAFRKGILPVLKERLWGRK
jgi:branched-chain amino acid transport system permease protein